jgi:hypothetical protein
VDLESAAAEVAARRIDPYSAMHDLLNRIQKGNH